MGLHVGQDSVRPHLRTMAFPVSKYRTLTRRPSLRYSYLSIVCYENARPVSTPMLAELLPTAVGPSVPDHRDSPQEEGSYGYRSTDNESQR